MAETPAHGSTAPHRCPDPLRTLRGLLLVTGLALSWLAATILVTAATADDGHRRTASLLAAMGRQDLAARPSGSPARLPGGDRAGVRPWHVPAARPAEGSP